jgi:MbtH protein
MANPFEAAAGEFVVLVNTEGEYSLWPQFRPPPAGWTAVGAPRSRQDCLEWIERNWTDMRPA